MEASMQWIEYLKMALEMAIVLGALVAMALLGNLLFPIVFGRAWPA